MLIFIFLIFIITLSIKQQQNTEIELVENDTALAGACNVPIEALNVPITEANEVEVVAEEEPQWVEMSVPSNNSFKSYMDYRTITDKTSAQYALLSSYENTACGIMSVDGRYTIAVGSYYSTEIGTRIDVVMQNGSIVPCILADCKNDIHTDSSNQQHRYDKSVVEFIVDTPNLVGRDMGDCSYSDERLMGEIKALRVYIEN